jgi:hypothetical protein
MPFDLLNAPGIFQRFIDMVLNAVVGGDCFVFIDDKKLSSSHYADHLKLV